MRKVNVEKIEKPCLKIMLQVFLPFNDGSGGGEVVDANDLCYLDESNVDIIKMFQDMLIDAKQISKHHAEIMKIRDKNKPAVKKPEKPAAKKGKK